MEHPCTHQHQCTQRVHQLGIVLASSILKTTRSPVVPHLSVA